MGLMMVVNHSQPMQGLLPTVEEQNLDWPSHPKQTKQDTTYKVTVLKALGMRQQWSWGVRKQTRTSPLL